MMADDLNLDLHDLDITTDEFVLDVHIQENLEDSVVKQALDSGVDLRQYSKQVENELLEVENQSIQDYIKEAENIASLHKQIAACDTILGTMEDMLNAFQEDLGSISAEIQTLQEQSISMNIKLKNRQAVRGELSQYVDEMAVPEIMITHVLDTVVTEQAFIEQLHELNHKINFVKEQSFKNAAASNDVKDILEKLKTKAISKIRDHLLQMIYKYKKPMINYQMVQRSMLKVQIFYEFLLGHDRQVAKEIRDEYVDTVSKVYYSYFKSYTSRLMKQHFEEIPDKDDLLGVEDTAKRGFFSKPSLKNRSTTFSLGNRGEILTSELEEGVIIPHVAQKVETKYPFEQLFRSQHYMLFDTCCQEYLFICDFFYVTGNNAQDLFMAILGKTLTMTLRHVEVYTNDSYDSIAIFLCIHIIYRYRVITHKRLVPALDRYWEMLLELLWPRFQYILELNIHSVRETDPQKLGSVDVRPHYVTRRYAEFYGAIMAINENYSNDKVHKLAAQLQADVENFILRMAAEFPLRKEQLIFLMNNYDLMLSVIMERTSDDSKEAENIKNLLNARTNEFIEEVLSPHFGGMMAFVKECEGMLERGDVDRLRHEDRRVLLLVRGFNSAWKKAIDTIDQDVMRSFTNFKNGTAVLQGALTQLIQYYHRFQKILSQAPFKTMSIRSELINIHHLMVEVKKHKPTF